MKVSENKYQYWKRKLNKHVPSIQTSFIKKKKKKRFKTRLQQM